MHHGTDGSIHYLFQKSQKTRSMPGSKCVIYLSTNSAKNSYISTDSTKMAMFLPTRLKLKCVDFALLKLALFRPSRLKISIFVSIRLKRAMFGLFRRITSKRLCFDRLDTNCFDQIESW